MSLDALDSDPHDEEPSLGKRLAHKLLGDPRKAPSRLLYLLVFALIAVIVVGVWSVVQTESNPEGSSYWVVRAVASVFNTMWVLVPVSMYFYWRWVGINRSRYASKAANVTGWLAETVTHLADEMRSTDGTTRVIATTDHSYEEIQSNVDAALRGDPHDSEEVDYFGRYDRRDDDGGDTAREMPALEAPDRTAIEAAGDRDDVSETRVEELVVREAELIAEYNELAEEIDDLLESALDGDLTPENLAEDAVDRVPIADLMDADAQADMDRADDLHDRADEIEQELAEVRAKLDELEAQAREQADQPAPESAPVSNSDSHTDDLEADPGLMDADDGGWSVTPDGVPDEAVYRDHPIPADETTADRPTSAREAWRDASGVRASLGAIPRYLGRRGVDIALTLLSLVVGALVPGYERGKACIQSWLSMDPEEIDDPEVFEVPWKVRFAEELKHFLLDLSASLHSDDLLWKFGLPAGVTFALLMLAAKLWVHPLLYVVFLAVAVLVGLFSFWLSKKRRSRRLKTHRQTEGWSYWDDAAGRVKTVETQDVTCYMGWLSGRRYASYSREEFVREFSLRLHQRTHDERVAPSVLEKYARNLAQMKPNLRGHLEQIERPQIQQEIKHAVESSRNQVIDKAGLAMEVIEHPGEDKRVTTDLGHDPRLVAQEYRWLVEDGHVLSEVEVEFEDASGKTTTKTLVYPAEKTRLPDMEALHSQFSDRFTGAHGDPYYHLPECNPTDDLRGFVPSPKVARMFRAAGGAD